MPITGPASYLPTTSEFLDHWQDVNTALGAAGPLVIPGRTIGLTTDVNRAALETLYNSLVAQHVTVQSALVAVDLARGDLEDYKATLLAQLNMFNEKVRALLGNTKWERALTEVPSISAGQGAFTDPLNGALALWQRINSEEALGPGETLVLRDGTDIGTYQDILLQLDGIFRALSRAERTLKLEREERNDIQDRIYPILKQYRVAVPGYFAADSAIMESLPRLTPEAGHTPAAVNASIVWDAATSKARIEWEASTDADLANYQVRYSPGTVYHEEDEDVLETFAPGDPRIYETNHALTIPGATALFRVYVILTTGNEKGGSTLEIMRP